MGFGQVLWSLLIIFFMVMFFMVFFMVVMDLFADKGLGGGKKAVWIIFLLIFPPITVLVYLIARGNSMAERRQAQMQAPFPRTSSINSKPRRSRRAEAVIVVSVRPRRRAGMSRTYTTGGSGRAGH